MDEVLFVDSIPDYFQNHSPEKIFVYYGKNTDSDAMGVPATFNGIEKYDVEKTTLHEVLFESRVVKSEAELELLEAEQARELELQGLELQPVASRGTLTDWLARKDLWQASENRLAQDPPHQGSCCADLPKSCLNTSKYD